MYMYVVNIYMVYMFAKTHSRHICAIYTYIYMCICVYVCVRTHVLDTCLLYMNGTCRYLLHACVYSLH